ncbi:uncharacterized protein EAE98_009719 [Botrytis deweyae]|uniref:DUF718 domain-containing protein n=2 Tax=Botrytis TaxID=33196 RepID=A0A4Z1JDN0_9HELO|nr:uncharacterized protein EAE98_009719 [Botrytis deweyae]KAF7918476.1 hypothetical protein EAE98_009719 [Botrytis deweyae]KAF7926484.1 hypothetical protein EAE99_005679 [Botrytis elliptica]TGO71795.1 hypothetical protein BELL_0529g00060 [Botrytis elliptica]
MWTNPRSPSPKMWSPRNPPPQSSHRSSHSQSHPFSPLSPLTPSGPSGTFPAPTQKLKNQGKRIAQIVKIKPECVELYKECHARVWPEVLKQIKECYMEDYSIHYDPHHNLLFASFKYVGYDYAGDMEKMRENPKVREWWAMTDSYQESLVEGSTGSTDERGWWKGVEEVFYVA